MICFDVAIFDLVHNVEAIFHLPTLYPLSSVKVASNKELETQFFMNIAYLVIPQFGYEGLAFSSWSLLRPSFFIFRFTDFFFTTS